MDPTVQILEVRLQVLPVVLPAGPLSVAAHAGPPGGASPWRNPRFRIFAAGNFANNVGEGAYKVALPLFAYETTDSLAVMSLLAALAPATLLLSPVLGVYVDRWGPRSFVVPGLLIQLAGAVALIVSGMAGDISVLAFFVFGAVVQIGGELYRAGWMAGVPGMFPDAAARSRGLLSTLFVLSNITGPLMLAALVPWVGYLGVLAINALTFLAPIAVWLIGVHPPRRLPKSGGMRVSLGGDLAQGWAAVRGERRVLYVKLSALPLHFVSGSGVMAFFFFHLADELAVGASTIGVAQATANAGALAGSLYVTSRSRASPRAVLAIAASGMTLALVVMPLQHALGFIALMALFFGLRSAVTCVSEMILVKFTSEHVLGRAAGLFNLMDGIPLLAAPLVIPLLHEALGSTGVFLTLGGVATVSLLLIRALWRDWGSGSDTMQRQSLVPPSAVTGVVRRRRCDTLTTGFPDRRTRDGMDRRPA